MSPAFHVTKGLSTIGVSDPLHLDVIHNASDQLNTLVLVCDGHKLEKDYKEVYTPSSLGGRRIQLKSHLVPGLSLAKSDRFAGLAINKTLVFWVTPCQASQLGICPLLQLHGRLGSGHPCAGLAFQWQRTEVGWRFNVGAKTT